MAHKLLTDIEVQGEGLFNGNLTLGTASTFSKLVFDTGGFDVGEIEVGSFQAMSVDAQDGVFSLMSNSSNQNHAIEGTMGGYVTLNHNGDKKLQTVSTGINITGLLFVSGDARVSGAFRDAGNSPGTSGQVLSSTVTGTSWITPSSGNVSGTGTTNNMTKWSNTTGGLADALMTDNGSTVTLSTNGSANTFNLFHTSGSGVALNIEKGGNNEGLIVNKTSGSGNAVAVTGDSSFYGKVGVGTATPDSILHVKGGEIDVSGGDGYRIENKPWATWSTDLLTLGDWDGEGYATRIMGSNSSEVMRVTGTKVGIGTVSPDYKLEVDGTLGVSRADGIIFAGSLGPGLGNKITSDTANNLIFSTSLPSAPYTTTEKVRILNNGNVGVGTTTPSSKLHSATTVSGPVDYTNRAAVLGVNNSTDTYYANSVGVAGQVRTSGGYAIYGDAYGAGGWAGYFDGKGYFSGNVGIGITNPATKLHIGSSSSSGSTTEEFRIQTSSSGGYGGYAVLNLVTGQYGTSGIYFGDQATYTNQPAYVRYVDVSNYMQYESFGSHIFTYSGNEVFRTNGYNVGIGTTIPGEKLEVNGTVKATEYKGYLPAFQHGGFYHSSSASSGTVYWIPTNYISETTSSQYYNNWVAPYSGRVKKIVMRYASGTTPTATSVTFKKSINGGGDLSSYPATIANAASTSMTVTRVFGSTDIAFNEGDRVRIGFTTNGGTRLLYGFAYTIVLEYDKD